MPGSEIVHAQLGLAPMPGSHWADKKRENVDIAQQ
jgi:hypothetical protein